LGNYINTGRGDPDMYNQFFRLRENPFNVNPDPRYLFLTRQTAEAWDGLKHGIQARKGLLVLTGEVGTGKTTLLNHLLDWLHQQHAPTAFIFNSHLEISQLFDFVLSDFAVKFDASLKDNALLRLHQWLWERYRAGDTPVVIVDEAQGLPDRVLEEIRMLLNLETSNEKLLQIVLAGQPEFEQRLQRPELRQVKQRIALRCKTAALSLDEAHQYVQARLQIAGADSPQIFASDAMDAVHFYSRGIPRVMNLLCEHALINASAEQIQPVPARFVAEVASEFQFDDSRPFAPASSFAPGPRPAVIPAQSRFLNALVSLSAADEHKQPPVRECLGPSVIPTARWHAAPDNVFSPVQETAAPFLHREAFQDDAADAPPLTQPFALPSELGLSSRSEHAIAPPFAQAFASPFAHAFAIRSEPQFALTSAPAIVPNFEHVVAPSSARASVSPSEPAFAPSSDQNFAARSEQSLALISEQNFTPPSDAPSVHLSSHSAPCTERPFVSRSQQDFATLAEPFNVQPASSAAPWHRQLEARLLADWTSFFSEIGTSLASDPAAEPSPERAAPTHPPRLHLVEAKTKTALGASSVANRKHAPGFQHLAPPSSRVAAARSFAVSSALMKLMSVRLILVGWIAKSRARFSSTVTASANSSAMVNVTALSARCLRPLRSLYWECLASADRCIDIVASIDWAQLQINASRWLRQPCDPTQWRVLDSRLLEDMFRFNHRKM
jgi:general secretion pathway protein A